MLRSFILRIHEVKCYSVELLLGEKKKREEARCFARKFSVSDFF